MINPNLEIRKKLGIQIRQSQNAGDLSRPLARDMVLTKVFRAGGFGFWAFEIRVCFGFRDSDFEFCAVGGMRLPMPR
jgi:hypothetical protein